MKECYRTTWKIQKKPQPTSSFAYDQTWSAQPPWEEWLLKAFNYIQLEVTAPKSLTHLIIHYRGNQHDFPWAKTTTLLSIMFSACRTTAMFLPLLSLTGVHSLFPFTGYIPQTFWVCFALLWKARPAKESRRNQSELLLQQTFFLLH